MKNAEMSGGVRTPWALKTRALHFKQLTVRRTIWQVKRGYLDWAGSKSWNARVGVLPYLGWGTANNQVKGVAAEGPAGQRVRIGVRSQNWEPCDMEPLPLLLLWGLPQIWGSSECEWSKSAWACAWETARGG